MVRWMVRWLFQLDGSLSLASSSSGFRSAKYDSYRDAFAGLYTARRPVISWMTKTTSAITSKM
jgi:hypothetical protein